MFGGPFQQTRVQVVVVILAAGVLLGLFAAISQGPPGAEPEPALAPPPPAGGTAFASYFIHFFPGRTADGSKPRAKTPLVRADTFLVSERVGLRVQTAPGAARAITAEIRFLTSTAREETAALERFRQRFRIRPGLRTYCCLRMPDTPGDYVLGLVVEDQFLAFIPVNVKEGFSKLQGGLFVRPEEE